MPFAESESSTIHPKLVRFVNTRPFVRYLEPQLFRPLLASILDACPDADSQRALRTLAYLWRDEIAYRALTASAEDGQRAACAADDEHDLSDVDSESLGIGYYCLGALSAAPEWFLDDVDLPKDAPGVAVLAEGLYWIDAMLRNDVERAWDWHVTRAAGAACGLEYRRRADTHPKGIAIARALVSRDDLAWRSLGRDYRGAWLEAWKRLGVLTPVRPTWNEPRPGETDLDSPARPSDEGAAPHLRLSAIAETLEAKVPNLIENHPGLFTYTDANPYELPPVELYRLAVDGELDWLAKWLMTDWPGKEIDYYSAVSRGGPGSDQAGRTRLEERGAKAWTSTASVEADCVFVGEGGLVESSIPDTASVWALAGDAPATDTSPDANLRRLVEAADRTKFINSFGKCADLVRVLMMAPKRLTQQELAEHTGRCARTIRRDLDDLRKHPRIVALRKKLTRRKNLVRFRPSLSCL